MEEEWRKGMPGRGFSLSKGPEASAGDQCIFNK